MRILSLIIVVGLASAQGATLERLGWMTGTWQGTVGRATVEEHWFAPKGARMLGVSQTVAKGEMVAFEFLRLEQRAEGVFYVAQPNGKAPVDFKLTRVSDNEAVFENPAHDHPKIITYRRDGDALVAKVEGDENGKHVEQEFRMRRLP